MRLLSPQHWAAENLMSSQYENKDSYQSCQLYNRNILQWEPNGEYTKTTFNSCQSNVPIMYTAPSNADYKVYQVKKFAEIKYEKCYTCYDAHEIESESTPSKLPTDTSTYTTEQINNLISNIVPRSTQIIHT